MTRIFRSFVPILLGFALIVAAQPASGQIDPGEISDLEARSDEITNELAQLDVRIIDADVEIDGLAALIDRREVKVELTGDLIERAVDSRREPERTRIEIALAGYTSGDPRGNVLLTEIRTIQGDDSPDRRREFYNAVIEDTQNRLDEIDSRLLSLREQLGTDRGQLVDTRAQHSDAIGALKALGETRTSLALELDDVRRRIAVLKSLENRSVLTGLITFDDPQRPALAIKIDNVGPARPQSGINEADIVFVEEVEGGLTRLAAVFHSTGATVVGPVRSMRTGDFDLLAQFNSPLFGNSGGNRVAREALAESTLVDVGAATNPGGYYRNTSRSAPHNLFTNAFNLWTIGAELETATPSPMFAFRQPDEAINPAARPAGGLTIDYPRSTVEYVWNGTSWDRSQDGSRTVDSSGVRTSPTTVIVQFVSYGVSAADAASPEAITIGDGTAWIFTDGQLIEAFWRRAELSDQTEYIDGQGRSVTILPGRTWVELPRPDSATPR